MDTDNTLHLLIIDESSNDAEMITNILRNAGLAVRTKRVEDDEDLEGALEEQTWDLIITADKLTFIDAYQALDIVRKTEKDIPLIVMANGADNINAGQALKAGACDLVKKDEDPDHLQCIVEREVSALRARRKLRVTNKSLRESEKRCRSLLDSSRDAITYVHEGMHIYANPVYMELFGYDSQDDVDGMPIMDMVSPQDQDNFKQFLRNYSKDDSQAQSEIEVQALRTDNKSFKATMEFTPASIDGEACTQIIIRTASDKELQRQLSILSRQDLLTGIFNRQYFMEVLDTAISKAATESIRSAMLYISIDNFGNIKETVGLSSSDMVISDIAKLLDSQVDDPDIIARFSDHCFTVLLKECSNDGAQNYAEKLCKVVDDHISDVAGKSVITTCSIGISVIGESAGSAQEVISRADLACNIAHDEGGNTVHLHNPIADEAAGKERVSAWVETINDALHEDSFFLIFQPIVSLHGDTKENYEVLLRLSNEDGNDVLPEEFFPAAQQANLVAEIDRWVISHAVERLAAERAQSKHTNFFIKLSASSLGDPTLLPWISELISNHRISGESLIFEITESEAVIHLSEAKAFISGVKQLHCQVVLDHFGSGLNSIKNLKHLDVNYLKIDGALITEITENEDSQESVKSIIQTAHAMGKLTIAEFVQDANSLALLWQFGVNYIQGYFLQEPSTKLNYDFSSDDEEE